MLFLLVGDWRSLALRGAAALIFGILALVWPGLTLWALVVLWGAYVLVDGISMLAGVAARVPGTEMRRAVLIFEGIVGVVIGVVTFVWPDITALALLYVIAAWALITGALELAAAVRLRAVIDNEWFLGLIGVLSILFGISLIITPGAGALVITWLIGWYAVLTGVLLGALAWRMRKLQAGEGGGRLLAGGSLRPRPT